MYGNQYDINYYTYGNAIDILTKKKFFVKIPRIYIYTEEEKKIFGIPVDEVNGKIDKKSVMDLVDSYKNVYELALIAYEDASILIKDENDIIEIMKLANEAINVLENSPNVKPNENNEDLVFALKTLLEKIQEANGDYLATLYRKNDPVKQYMDNTFGAFDAIASIKRKVPEVEEITPSSTNERVYGIDFDKISI